MENITKTFGWNVKEFSDARLLKEINFAKSNDTIWLPELIAEYNRRACWEGDYFQEDSNFNWFN